MQIREGTAGDAAALRRLYPAAFPEEDLLPLVTALLQPGQPVLSLVAEEAGEILGHVAFTRCGPVALLGPLAVAPARQGAGIGSALVRAGLERMRDAGLVHACVLGDPGYYGRFGFRPEHGVQPPCQMPPEWEGAWQGLALVPGDAPAGPIDLPPVWQPLHLWQP